MARPIIIYQTNSGYIPVTGLTDGSFNPPQFINSPSSITATLKDPTGADVSGMVDVEGVYVTGSNGNFEFPVPATISAPVGAGYTLVVDIVAQSGAAGHWEIPVSIQVRGQGAGT